MNFLDAVMWRLSKCTDMKHVTAKQMADSMGVSIRVFGTRLKKEGWSWTRLKDRERCYRYLLAKRDNPDLPAYKLSDMIGCSSPVIYDNRNRWERRPYKL